ncbi:MAG: MopE-related protein [Bacteroidota bacterium]
MSSFFRFLVVVSLTITTLPSFSQSKTWQDLMLDENANFYDVQDAFNQHWNAIPRPYPKGKGFMAYKRWEWFMEPRVYPSGKRMPANAIELAKQQSPGLFPPANGSAGLWTYVGNTSVPSGGGVGRVNSVRVQPGSTTTYYACAPAGGLWKTTNSGTSWTCMNTDFLTSIGVTDIAIDPNNTNTLYLATGDGDASDTYSLGVLKSTDGGATWNTTGLNWAVTNNRTTSRILIHPSNSNILLAATSNGIYKTTDAGVSWTLVQSGSFKDLEFKPSDPTVVYASGGTFMKSTNTGDTFTTISAGLPTTNVNRISIAVSAANNAVVYLLVSNNTDYGLRGVYKSTDSGTNFTTAATTPNLLGWNSNGGDAGGQGWYDLTIEANSSNANEVYVGGVNIWKSTNGGTSWSINGHWTGSGAPYVHADVHCLTWLPASNSLLVGCDGGVFKTSNGGTSYSDISSNLEISQQYRLSIAQLNGNKILTGWQDNGTNLKNGTTHTNVLGGDGMECIIARTDANVMYGEIYYGAIYKSTNGVGFSALVNSGGTGVNEDGAWVTPYALGATDNDLYVGKTKIYKSTNAGTSFTALGAFGTGVINAFAVSLSNANVIYASKGAALYKTTNANAFTALSGLPNLYITSIAVDPTDENHVYVSVSGYTAGSKVYESTNGGTTWSNISGSLPNIPANTLAYHSNGTDAIYVGTDAGVYYKDNSLTDWIPYMNGLPNVVIDELEIHTSTNTITAATFGRGTWRAPLYTQPALDLALVSVDSPTGNFCSTTVTPSINIMNVGTSTITSFILSYTISGQTSQTYTYTGSLTSGSSTNITLSTSTLAAGSYTLTLNLTSVNGGSDENATNDALSQSFTIVSGAANDICADATNLTLNAAYVTANNTVTCTDGPDPSCGGGGMKDVWYKFTYTGGDITIQTNSGSMADTRLAVYEDCTLTNQLGCNDDISTTNYNSRINLTCSQLTNGMTYYIQAGGYATGTGTFGIQVLATTIAGCTNVNACNYNECANSDNGSCILPSTYYLDADADGYYVSTSTACSSPGVGYTTTAGISGDCNDNNSNVNAGATEICGNGIDEDCSGSDLACAVSGCTDNTACNFNAAATVDNGSCTYAVSYYLDADADGYYVSTSTACSSPGAGYTTTTGISGDCNDNNANVNAGATEICSNLLDDNCNGNVNEGCYESNLPGDNFTSPINLPVTYYPTCNAASGNLNGMGASPFAQTTCITGEDQWYQFTAQTEGVSIVLNTSTFDALIELQSVDGTFIAEENAVNGLGNEILNFMGLNSGTTYRVGIRNYNSALGTGSYTCCVKQLKRGGCSYGPGPYSLCQIFKAQFVSGAQYRYLFTGNAGPANGQTFTKLSNTDLLVLNSVTPTLPYGSSYNVLISNVYNLSNGAGTSEIIEVPNTAACAMNTIAEPLTQLLSSQNCSSGPRFRSGIVQSSPWVCGAINWKWKFQEIDGNGIPIGLPIEHLRNAASNTLNLGTVAALQNGKTYQVQTAPVFGFGVGSYGPIQTMCIIGLATVANDNSQRITYENTDNLDLIQVYPNPVNGNQITIQLSNEMEEDYRQIQLTSMMGQQIVLPILVYNGIGRIDLPDYFGNGIYMLELMNGKNTISKRIMVTR